MESNKCVGRYWDFGRMDVACLQCGALHYIDDRVKNNTRENPKFLDTYNYGKVHFALDIESLQCIQDLYKSRQPKAMYSRSNERSDNSAASMASVTANWQEEGPGESGFNITVALQERILQSIGASYYQKDFVAHTPLHIYITQNISSKVIFGLRVVAKDWYDLYLLLWLRRYNSTTPTNYASWCCVSWCLKS